MRVFICLFWIGFLSTLSVSAFSNSEVELKSLAPGVWLHTSYYTYPSGVKFPSNGLLVQDGQGVILIDTAWGELATVELLEQIKYKIKLPVTLAIVTHSHADRLAGADVLKSQGIPVYSHSLTQKLSAEYGLPVPDKTLDLSGDSMSSTSLGVVEIVYPGAGHAQDNLMIWLPESKILYGGCAVRGKGATSVGNRAHSDLNSWFHAMQLISDRYQSAEMVIPGHGEYGDFSLVKNTLDLIEKERRIENFLSSMTITGHKGMYGIIGKLNAVSGKRDELISILIEGTQAMPGCLSYIIAKDESDLDAIWITEVWINKESHQASLALPSVQKAIGLGRPIIAGFGERFETAPVGGQGLIP